MFCPVPIAPNTWLSQSMETINASPSTGSGQALRQAQDRPFDRLRTSSTNWQMMRIFLFKFVTLCPQGKFAHLQNSHSKNHSTGKEHAENLQITLWTPCALWQSFLAHSFDALRPDKIMRCYTLSCIMQPIANNRQFTYRSASHCQRNACSQSAAWISSPSPSAINGGMDD